MDDCIIWDGPIWAQGRYGMDKIAGKSMGAHRAAYIRKFGDIPDGLVVCHSCDNGLCVNTNHLFLGTSKDNMQDCLAKGRMKHLFDNQKGQNNANAKPGLVARNKLIKQDREAGLTFSQIKQKYEIKSNGHLVEILRSSI